MVATIRPLKCISNNLILMHYARKNDYGVHDEDNDDNFYFR